MLKIWDNKNKQWLEPMAIYFKDNEIYRITACKPNTEVFSEGWYVIEGRDLKKVAVTGEVNFNTKLLPK